MDTDNNGLISKEELIAAYKQLYGSTMDAAQIKAEVEKVFKKADADGNGEIDFTEWSLATIDKRSILKDGKLKGAF